MKSMIEIFCLCLLKYYEILFNMINLERDYIVMNSLKEYELRKY